MAEYEHHQSTVKKPKSQAKRKYDTANNVNIEPCSNCKKLHPGDKALCWAPGGDKHVQRGDKKSPKYKGNPKGKVKGNNQNVNQKCGKCGRTNHDGIKRNCFAKHCTICDAMYNEDGHVKCAEEKAKIRASKDTANKYTEIASSEKY